MNSLNQAQILGNLTADPEVKETPNGAKVATFSVATNRQWKDDAGNKKELAEFHNVVLWRGLAEIAEEYLKKGKKVFVSGYLQTRSWDDEASGTKKYRTEIIGEKLIMLGDAKHGDNAPPISDEDLPPVAKKSGADTAGKTQSNRKDEEINIEDIPF